MLPGNLPIICLAHPHDPNDLFLLLGTVYKRDLYGVCLVAESISSYRLHIFSVRQHLYSHLISFTHVAHLKFLVISWDQYNYLYITDEKIKDIKDIRTLRLRKLRLSNLPKFASVCPPSPIVPYSSVSPV